MSFVEEISLTVVDKASGPIGDVTGALRSMLREIGALVGVTSIGASFGALVKGGLEFQKTLEDSRIGIAGIIGALHTYRDTTGYALAGEAAWSAALSDSATVQEKLRTAALTTTASYTDMVEAFQVGVGPMSRAGIALADAAEATQRLTQVAGAAGLPMAQLGIEMRQFFAGDEVRSRLLQTLQITKEQIEEHKRAGDMMDFLRAKTESYARAAQAAADTMTGRWSNLKDAIQQTLGMGMEPLYAKVKEALGTASSQFVSFGQDSKGNVTAQFSPEVLARVQRLGELLADALDRLKEMLPAAVDFGLALSEHISKAIDLLSRLPLKPVLDLLTDLTEATNGWGLAIGGVVYALGGISGITGILGGVKAFGASVALVFVEITARIIAASGAATGLASTLAGFATGGIFTVLIAEIGLLVYTIKLAAEEAREAAAAAQAETRSAETMIANIDRWQERFKGLGTGPVSPAVEQLRSDLQKLEDFAKLAKDIKAPVTDEMMAAYRKLGSSVRELLPPLTELQRGTNGMGEEAKEAAYHIGIVWPAASAKASAALADLGSDVVAYLGDHVAVATAKVEKEFEGLKGKIGFAMGQGAIAFQDGLVILERIAAERGQKITKAIFNGTAAVEDFISVQEAVALRFGFNGTAAVEDFISVLKAKLSRDDVFVGLKEGWRSVAASIPTVAESAANAVRDVWAGMTRAFDDLFFNVLSGRLSSLKDVFKNLWQSLLQTFSRFLSDMVQRWVKSQIEMSQSGYTGKAFNVTSYGPNGEVSTASGAGTYAGGGSKPGVWGYLGAAGTGYGLGSSIGPGGAGNQWGGAIGAVGGLALGSTAGVIAGVGSAMGLGAAAGSVVPIIGTIVGALIGAIIGGLFNKSTEKSVEGSLGAMAGATKWDWIPGYTRTNRRTGEETEVPGQWYGYVQRPKTAFERQGEQLLQSQAASLSDLFRAGAKDQAHDLMAAYQSALKESLSGAWFKISAGSTEDIEKDAEYVLKTLLPRIGLAAAFGQTGYLPSGDRNAPGGIPGVNWGMPGMDLAGNWTGAKQLFDPEAPIPKMLAGLGFTAERIGEIAGLISTDDPQKLLSYLKGIVGVVVGLRDLGAEMGKSFATLTKEWADEAAAGPAASFAKRAQELVGQFNDLSLYSGDEQVTKAQEALAASSEFWESVKSYLSELNALGEKLSAGLQGMREKMRAFLNPLSEADSVAADWTNVEGVWGRLFASMSPAEIEKAANDAAASIDRIFSVMAERITRGNAAIDKAWALFGKLGSLGSDIASEQLLQTNPLRAFERQLVDMQERITKAATLSGLEQIAALEDVNASAEEMYGNLKSFLSDIASVSKSINESISSQIWELGVGELDPAGQATAVGERIRQLQEQLQLATSPAEVQAIVSEIQSLTTRYVGQFGKDDANRADAIAWAQEQLERARGLANETLEALRKTAEEQATELRGILKGAADLLSSNVSEASGVIGQLSHTLGELDKAVQEALGRLGQSALDALGPLRTAFEEASGIFTSATGDAVFTLTGPEGFTAGLSTSTEALGGFEAAVRRAGNALKQIGYGGDDGSAKSTQKVSSGARVSSAQIVSTVRRYSGHLKPRVA